MNDSQINKMLVEWNRATAAAKWGVQRVFHDVLSLAAEGKTTLIYGKDYHNGNPCLVNTVGAMLTTGGGSGVPLANFQEIVSLFDKINAWYEEDGVNDKPGYVSPAVAEYLLLAFAQFSPEPPEIQFTDPSTTDDPYYEPSDEQMAKEMISLFTMECPSESTLHMATENNELHAILPVVNRDGNF